jgi:molecular chaperone GrpE
MPFDQSELDHELPASSGNAEEPSNDRSATKPASASDNELDRIRAERDALADRAARLQAEFENARKRAAREQQDFRSFALADALKSLLPVLDSFDRALQAPARPTELLSGVELIRKQLDDALAKLGLSRVPAEGAAFDPLVHQAIDVVEDEDSEDERVVEELQRGYKLGDRLLRPAMVRVAQRRKAA